MQDEKFPKIGVSALLVKDNKVLLVKRGKEPFKGFWSLPGGLLEFGEEAKTATIREVKEETELNVQEPEFLTYLEAMSTDGNEDTPFHYVLLVFLFQKIDGIAKAGDDAADCRWVDDAELDKLRLTPKTAEIISKYASHEITER